MKKVIYMNNLRYEYESLNELAGQLEINYVSLGNGVRLGNYVRLGNGVRLGNYVSLGNGVRLGNDVRLGNYVSLGNGVRLGNDVRLGNYVRLGNGVSLGNDVSLGESPLYISSDLPYIFNGYNDRIQIGCKDYSIDYWLEHYRTIAESADIDDELVIGKYFKLIELYSTWEGVKK